nr:MAG TPA: Receptor binding protein [Caudoviricetes sp.]
MRSQVAFSYGGHCLDSSVDGFTTLSVSGRGGFTRAVTATDLASDGAKYLSSRIESKKLTVNFFLQASSLSDLADKTGKLKKLLSVRNTEVSFADDGYRYTGTVTSLTFDDTTLHPTGTIEITLSDPYCYSAEKTITGTGTSVNLSEYDDTGFANLPAAIEFTPSEGISTFQVTSNQGKHFLLNQSVSAGKKIVVDFRTLSCTVDGANVLSSVSLNSNFADFTIDKNTVLTFNADGRYLVRFEVKKL